MNFDFDFWLCVSNVSRPLVFVLVFFFFELSKVEVLPHLRISLRVPFRLAITASMWKRENLVKGHKGKRTIKLVKVYNFVKTSLFCFISSYTKKTKFCGSKLPGEFYLSFFYLNFHALIFSKNKKITKKQNFVVPNYLGMFICHFFIWIFMHSYFQKTKKTQNFQWLIMAKV